MEHLHHNGLALVNVMVVALLRGIQPLQQHVHPMWEFNGVTESTRAIRGGFHEDRPLKEMLAMMFKGEASDFSKEPRFDGFSTNTPVQAVSSHSQVFSPDQAL